MVHSFSTEQYRARIGLLVAELHQRGLAGILLLDPASVQYFTGCPVASYPQPQALVVSADRHTTFIGSFSGNHFAASAIVDEVRPWGNDASTNPTEALGGLIRKRIGTNQRFGVEFATAMLNAQRGALLEASFVRSVDIVDASDLVPALRLQKSDAELLSVRRAAKITDAAFCRALAGCRTAGSEANLLVELYRGVQSQGGAPVIGRYVHAGDFGMSQSGRARPDSVAAPTNQFNVEFAAAYRGHQVALTRTILTRCASPEQVRMHSVAVDAIEACRKTLHPGRSFGDVFAAHAITLDRRGYHRARLNACGYSLDAGPPSNWTGWPAIYAENPTVLVPGAVVFLNIALADPETNTTMTLGESYIVTDKAPERLSSLDYSLIMR